MRRCVSCLSGINAFPHQEMISWCLIQEEVEWRLGDFILML